MLSKEERGIEVGCHCWIQRELVKRRESNCSSWGGKITETQTQQRFFSGRDGGCTRVLRLSTSCTGALPRGKRLPSPIKVLHLPQLNGCIGRRKEPGSKSWTIILFFPPPESQVSRPKISAWVACQRHRSPARCNDARQAPAGEISRVTLRTLSSARRPIERHCELRGLESRPARTGTPCLAVHPWGVRGRGSFVCGISSGL